ncbi:MAG: hypothetical protein ACRDRN_14395 [Sciscionella sp.]
MVVSTGGGPRVAEPVQTSALTVIGSLPRELANKGKRAVRTSPGRLVGLLSVTIVLLLVAGIVSALMVQQKRTTLNALISSKEPVASATHQVFRALADADATTITSFLNGGQDPAKLQARYHADIQQASKALAVAATADLGSNSKQLREITVNLPVYTGLIERAYANQRQGFPIGSSYLHEAYGLMTQHLLQPASVLFTAESNAVADEQDSASGFPWWSTVFAVLLLAALIYTQMYLRKRTNRLFNTGLAVATIAVLVSLLWSASALIVGAVHVSTARSQGAQPAAELQKMELSAITARAVETLTLVNRNPGAQYEKAFQQFRTSILGDNGDGGGMAKARSMAEGTDLAGAVGTITRDAKAWLVDTHNQIRQFNDKGQIEQAVHLAVANNSNSAGSQFNKLDNELLAAIGKARTTFAKQTSAASNALTFLQVGILLLTVIAVIGSIVGVSRRLQEYR